MGEYIPVTLIIYTHEYITPNRAGDDDDDVNDDDDDVFLSSLSFASSLSRGRASRANDKKAALKVRGGGEREREQQK